MALRSSPSGLVVSAVLAITVGLCGPGAGSAEARSAVDASCAVPSAASPGGPARPVRLDDALRNGLSAAVVRSRNQVGRAELAHLAQDDTTWVDPCAKVFVVDRAAPPAQLATLAEAPAGGVPGDVFDLSSRPGSTRTVYLDFDGATYSGTGWRNGEQIVSPAYSVDGDPATFTEVERAQVYLAWQVVAEDFAPFDVNVTTRPPAASALTRSSLTDPTYGMPVVVTPTNAVGSGCACGGAAYVGVLGNPAANDYQPAWVFTNGSGTNGYNVGQAISHEVGHSFGLSHDGTGQSGYYSGAKGWAPIMGASYNRRASQWSRGEYAGATTVEDDLAIIGRLAPVVVDDHADQASGATPLAVGSSVSGLVTTRSDVDAFSFAASGPTVLTVAGPAGVSDLDARLTVLDASGAVVAVVDPVADSASDASMSATWSAELSGSATYVALVDGVGTGDPLEPGRYSDYGSVGAYTLTMSAGPVPPTSPTSPTSTTTTTTVVSTTPATPSAPSATDAAPTAEGYSAAAPVRFLTTRIPVAHVGRRYRAEILFTGAVAKARLGRLPRGLRWRVSEDRVIIVGRPGRRTTAHVIVDLTGAADHVRTIVRLVVRER